MVSSRFAESLRLAAGVHQHEAAGAVGVLGHAGREAGLAEQRRLLVARDAAERDLPPAEAREGLAMGEHRGHDPRQHRTRDPEQLEHVLVPLARADVEQQRAARVGRVGEVQRAARELPGEPAVDGAEGELAALRPRAQPGVAVEQPRELGAGEVRVEQQAGAPRHLGLVALGLEPRAGVGRAAVLPDDGRRHGSAGGAIPQHRGLALVGDADGGHEVVDGGAGARHHLRDRRGLRGPDLLGVVLHPARAGEVLGELALRRGDDAAVVIEQDGARAGRALVEGEHESCHGNLSWAGRLHHGIASGPGRRVALQPVVEPRRAVGRNVQRELAATVEDVLTAVTAHSSRRR